jgi:hypothetical protein
LAGLNIQFAQVIGSQRWRVATICGRQLSFHIDDKGVCKVASGQVWPLTYILLEFFKTKIGLDSFKGLRVLELGAGLGLVGMVNARAPHPPKQLNDSSTQQSLSLFVFLFHVWCMLFFDCCLMTAV